MMSKPAQNRVHVMHDRPRANLRPFDHDDRSMQRMRSNDFRQCPCAACILGHHQLNIMRVHQFQIPFNRERPTIKDNRRVGQRNALLGRVDETQNVVVLRVWRESAEMHASNGQHYTRRRSVECCNGARNVRYAVPLVPRLRQPRWAFQRDERHTRFGTGRNRIVTHLAGKGMRRVDNMGCGCRTEVIAEPFDASKATNAHRQNLRLGARNTSSQRKRGTHINFGQSRAERCRFERTAQYQKVRWNG